MMIPYPCLANNTHTEKRFNKIHAQARGVIECAFGRLKGRFRILLTTLAMKSPRSIGRTIVACCVLHNLTTDFGDDVDLEQVDPLLHYHRRERVALPGVVDPLMQSLAAGITKRDAIKERLILMY